MEAEHVTHDDQGLVPHRRRARFHLLDHRLRVSVLPGYGWTGPGVWGPRVSAEIRLQYRDGVGRYWHAARGVRGSSLLIRSYQCRTDEGDYKK